MAIIEVKMSQSLILSDHIDLPAYIKIMLERISDLASQAPLLSEDVRRSFDKELSRIKSSLAYIEGLPDKQTREVALDVVASALRQGFYHPGTPEIVRAIEVAHDKQRMRPAHKGRRNAEFQKLLMCESNAYWDKSPTFKGNSNHTAARIYASVESKIKIGSSQPSWWAPKEKEDGGLESDEKVKARRIRNVAKRLARAQWQKAQRDN